jgi:hypothetical protein
MCFLPTWIGSSAGVSPASMIARIRLSAWTRSTSGIAAIQLMEPMWSTMRSGRAG